MVRLFTSLIVLLFLVFIEQILSQNNSEINSKQNELKIIKTEISSLEKEILRKRKKEKESFNILQNYDKQGYLLNKIIGQYRTEEKKKEEQILNTEQRITYLSNEITKLQSNYAKYVNAVYRKQQKSDLEAIFDSESISHAIRRIFYLKKFSERREIDLNNLEISKNELLNAKTQLEMEKEEKALLIKKKIDEEKLLKNKTVERKQILNAIKKDKNELKNELDAKKKAEITIRSLIARLIEEKIKRDKELKEKSRLKEEQKLAEKKKEKNVSTKKTNTLSRQTIGDESSLKNFSSFELLKGKLNWPVSNGKIIRKYGENRNPILNTVLLNYGVDIKVAFDLNIRAVSNGTISAIEWIPGYGSIIIISHAEDYRTVYSHLDGIFVQEGDAVNAGQLIASVGESLEGHILHFEIWNSRSNQNPEIWLAKK